MNILIQPTDADPQLPAVPGGLGLAHLRARPLATSLLLHVVAAALALLISLATPQPRITAEPVRLALPPARIAPEPEPKPPKPLRAPGRVPAQAAALRLPRDFILPVIPPAPRSPEPEPDQLIPPPVLELPVTAPTIELPQLELPAVSVPAPRQIRLGNLTGAVTAPQPAAPARQVTDSGFSTGTATSANSARGTISTGGFGAARTGDVNERAREVRTDSGFGQASANTVATTRGTVTEAGFGAAKRADPDGPRQTANASPNSQPLQILSKPQPEYTQEGRQLRIEGEVVVDLWFRASGEVEVVAVLQGLGHGLDQNAVAAARQIRFRPATRGGAPVDSRATVRISFQLAQ